MRWGEEQKREGRREAQERSKAEWKWGNNHHRENLVDTGKSVRHRILLFFTDEEK